MGSSSELQLPAAPDRASGEPQGASWPVPWGVAECIGVVAVTAALMVVVLFVVPLLDRAFGLPEQVGNLLLPLPLIVLGAVTVAWVHLRHRAAGALNGPVSGGVREWLRGFGLGVLAFLLVNVGIGVALQLLAEAAGVDLPTPQPGLREAAADPEMVPWLFLSAVVVAPVAEELFFRGMLYPALRRSVGRWGGIVLSAVVFAAAHLIGEVTLASGALTVAMILPLGVVLAWLYERRRTLSVPIALHAAFNAVTFALLVGTAGSGT